MSDAEFVKAFEDDHEEEYDIKFTLIPKKTIPFFMANISRQDREELQCCQAIARNSSRLV